MKVKLLLILVALSLAVALSPGCTTQQGAGQSTSQPEVKPIEWNYQAVNPAGSLFVNLSEEFVKRVNAASGGRIVLKLNYAGALVPTTTEIQSISDGVVPIGRSNPSYNIDKIPSAGLFNAMVGGMTHDSFKAWYERGGGADFMNRAYADMNVHIFSDSPCVTPDPETFMHAAKPIRSMADMKGLRMRAMGDGGKILQRIGVAVVFIPSNEAFEGMQRGLIDAFEVSSPGQDYSLSVHEVAEYQYFSPTRSPTDTNIVVVNRSLWEGLAPDLQQILIDANRAATSWHEYQIAYANAVAFQKFKEFGVKIAPLPEDIESAFVAESLKYYDEMAASNPLAAEVIKSQRAFKDMFTELGTLNAA